MIAETQRQVVIFTGRGASPSTIELIETISQSFPHGHFTIFQEIKPRRLGPYFRGKIRRLGREPFSYLLELFVQLCCRFRLPSTGRVTGGMALPRSYTELVGANVSHERRPRRDAHQRRLQPHQHHVESTRFEPSGGAWGNLEGSGRAHLHDATFIEGRV